MFKKKINKIFGSIYDDIINDEEYFNSRVEEVDVDDDDDENNNNTLANNSIICDQSNVDDLLQLETSFIEPRHGSEPIYAPKSYRNFDTIDWLNENIANKIDSIATKTKLIGEGGCCSFFKYLFEMASGWFVVMGIGLFGGMLLPLMLVGGEWLTDLRQGYCSSSFFHSYYECCRLTKISYSYSNSCADWVTWGDALGLENVPFKFSFNYVIYVGSSMLAAGAAAFIVKLLAPYSCGTGITEIKTILSGFVIRGFLGIRTSIVKFITALLTIGSGLNVSHEGVLIHVCSSSANWLSHSVRKFNTNAAKLREVIGAGACAGFSVAFSAPISGLLFGLETMCYHFPSKTVWRTFSCVLFATFMFMQFKHVLDSDEALLTINSTGVWHFRELLPFSLLGILGGLFGAFFKFLIEQFSLIRKTTIVGDHPILEVVFLAFITSLLSFPISIFRGGTYGALRNILSVCLPFNINSICNYVLPHNIGDNNNLMEPTLTPLYPDTDLHSMIWKLPMFGLIKLILTAATTSAKIPTGFFLPIFISGACFGRSLGIAMEFLKLKYEGSSFFQAMCYNISRRCISPEVYAVIGACAFLSGVTHLTITLVVLIVELTNRDDFIVPMMLCVTISKVISEKLKKASIFQCQSEINNYPYMDKILDKTLDKSINISIHSLFLNRDRNSYKYIVLYNTGMNLSDVFHVLENDFHGYPLVDNNVNMNLLGYVKRHNLMDSLALDDQLNCDDSILNQQISFSLSSSHLHDDNHINLSAVIDYNILQVDIKSSIDVLAEYFQLLGIRNVLVISHGRFLGLITKKDFLSFLS